VNIYATPSNDHFLEHHRVHHLNTIALYITLSIIIIAQLWFTCMFEKYIIHWHYLINYICSVAGIPAQMETQGTLNFTVISI
jgi:hypothetical protein